MSQKLLISGRPGVGKTTVVERVVAALPPGAAVGFFTREIRERGERTGFAVHTLDSRTTVLARVGAGGGPRVGRYRVRLAAFEEVALPALASGSRSALVVIDEIGRMECLSSGFCNAVRTVLDGPRDLLATIARHGGGFIAEVRQRDDVDLLDVTAENRERLPGVILARLGLAGPTRGGRARRRPRSRPRPGGRTCRGGPRARRDRRVSPV